MSQVRVSVVIPTCHRNDLLARCLDRLAPGAQTLPFDQYEVIITDDGSRSTAEALIDEHYPWALWIPGPRRGPAANRNHGVSQARGTWIAFTDDDCLPCAGWLQAYTDALKHSIFIYEGMTTCEAGLRSPLETSPVNLSGGYLWSCNMLVAKQLLERVGGFDVGFPEPCNEDVELRERFKRSGYEFRFVLEAAVDHPPRPQLLGRALARRAESQVRLWYALGKPYPCAVHILWYYLYGRPRQFVRFLLQYPLSVDLLRWLFSIFAEVAYIAAHVRGWDAKHRYAYCKQQPEQRLQDTP